MRNRLHRWISLCLISLFAAAYLPPQSVIAASPVVKHILIIQAFTPDYLANEQYIKGLKDKLDVDTRYKFSYSYEYFDMARHFKEEDYLDKLAQYMEMKYKAGQPDFIVMQGDMLQFMEKYGKQMFPGVPAIIASDENNLLAGQEPSNYVFISQSNYSERNIRLIMETRPMTKQIYIVIGDSPFERNIIRYLQKEEKQYADRVKFVYMNKWSYGQILEAVENAREDSAILYFRRISDVEGENFIPEQAVKTITREAKAPVYGTEGHNLGSGIIGGYVRENEITGQAAAEAIFDLLGGKKPSDIPVIKITPCRYVFDWRQLKRWGIDEKKLPESSRVDYRVESFWELYSPYIVGTLVLLLLQALLIFGLLVNQRRRKKAEKN